MKVLVAALTLLQFCGFLRPTTSSVLMEKERFDNWDSILSLSDSFDVQPQNADKRLDPKSHSTAPRKQFQLETAVSPTHSPTFVPTSATTSPTFSPTAPTTHVPTFAPTIPPTSETPSVAPTTVTEAPSFAPTTRTDAPSIVPSLSPSLNPSAAPSMLPTTATPTFSPTTTAPSMVPTSAAPSRLPTKAPSVTRYPTAARTRAPTTTAAPTTSVAPTPSPSTQAPTITRSPSLAPSRKPSAFPSYSPTIQVLPVVVIFSNIALMVDYQRDLNDQEQYAVRLAQSRILNVNINVIVYIRTDRIFLNATATSRRLQEGGVANYTVAVTSTSLSLVDYPEYGDNVTALFDQVSNTMSESVNGDEFTLQLGAAAVEANASNFINVTIPTALKLVTLTLNQPPTFRPTYHPRYDNGLTDGEVAAIVVVSIVGTAILAYIVYVSLSAYRQGKGLPIEVPDTSFEEAVNNGQADHVVQDQLESRL